MMQKIQQDLAKVGIEVELSPVTVRELARAGNGDGIPADGRVLRARLLWHVAIRRRVRPVGRLGLGQARRRGHDPSIINPRDGQAARSRRSRPPTAEAADKLWFEAGELMAKDQIIMPHGQPGPDPGLWPERQGRALQRLLQPAAGRDLELIVPGGRRKRLPSLHRRRGDAALPNSRDASPAGRAQRVVPNGVWGHMATR